MIGNIKETFLPKTGMQRKQVLQDPGYVEGVEGSYYMLHATARNTPCPHINGVKEIKTNKID